MRIPPAALRPLAFAAAVVMVALLGAGVGRRLLPDGSPGQRELLVAAASDLRFAFAEIGERFEQETGITVTFNFGSTGLLTQQIENGAPFDVFFSANRAYVDRLVQGGFGAGDPQVYAIGYVALAVPRGSVVPLAGEIAGPAFETIAIANPAHAPYGVAARQVLQQLKLYDRVRDRLVYGENVLDAMRLVETGNADVGLVALAFLDAAEGLLGEKIDAALHEPIEQTALVLREAENSAAAEEFSAFVNDTVGRQILVRYRFGLPQ